MHAMPTDPRRLLLTAVAALILALAMATILGDLDTLSISSTDSPASTDTQTTTGGGSPAWLENPMRSPLVELHAPTVATP